VLQEREVERVGGKKPVALDIRILATSNRDMAAEVRVGRFREDLFYRLNVFPLEIPSLRERPGDIVPLARKALAQLAAVANRAAKFAASAEDRLVAYAWPGNVRELENVVQRALILESGEVIEADGLPLGLLRNVVPAPAAVEFTQHAGALPPMPVSGPGGPAAGPATDMKTLERQHIQEVLASVGGSRKKAVAILGISERTLRYKLNQYRSEGSADACEEI
jgi:two-component system response regulator FlrC